MARGGSRPGAGRKKGNTGNSGFKPESKSKAVATIHEEVASGPPPPPEETVDAESGALRRLTPKEVMDHNMNWAHRMGIRIQQKAHHALGQGGEDGKVLFLDLMAELERVMDKAQKYAEGLAPYEHARLAATVPQAPPNPEDEKRANQPISPDDDHLAAVGQRFAKFVPKVHQGGRS